MVFKQKLYSVPITGGSYSKVNNVICVLLSTDKAAVRFVLSAFSGNH